MEKKKNILFIMSDDHASVSYTHLILQQIMPFEEAKCKREPHT